MSCPLHAAQMLAGAGAFFAFGAAGSLHCAGMCGPLACLAGGAKRRGFGLYHLARLSSYGGVGALLQALGSPWRNGFGWPWSLLLALPLLLFALRPHAWPQGLAWLHVKAARPALLWSPERRALVLGLLTPLLPCGLFWTAALAAALAPTPWLAAGWMLSFAGGTLPLLSVSQSGWALLASFQGGAWAGRLQRASALLTAGLLIYLSRP